MATVYILTIEDLTKFSKVIHHSVWSSYAKAQDKASQVVARAMFGDANDDWHPSERDYNVSICQMTVDQE